MPELTAIASDFRDLAGRFNRSAAQCAKVTHIATNLQDNAGKAGRLLYRAIELGAFPKEHAKQNGQWWDAKVGRWPGGFLAAAVDDKRPSAKLMRKVSAAVCGVKATPADDAVFRLAWTVAVGSWLFQAFPARFRCKANEWDFAHVKTDERGRPCDREGKALRYHLFLDDKPIPDDFLSESDYAALLRFPPLPMPPAIVERLDQAAPGWKKWEMKLDPVVMVEHEYDEADAMEHSRIRCEVYADACKVLAELIDQAAATMADDAKLTPGNAAPIEQEWMRIADGERVTGINRGTIQRATKKGEIEGNGEEGDKRRIRSSSLTAWALKRGKNIEKAESDAQVEAKLGRVGL